MNKRRAGSALSSANSDERLSARVTAQLPSRLERRIVSYAMAAGATGVGLLALAAPAKADIIYTRANISFSHDDQVHLNSIDVSLSDRGFSGSAPWGTALFGTLRAGGSAEGGVMMSRGGEAVLHAGQLIGPSGLFTNTGLMAKFRVGCSQGGGGRACGREGSVSSSSGPWARRGEQVGFLGIKFTDSNGAPHFGWAELTITPDFYGYPGGGYDGTVIGYAYDTVPNQSILAGQGNGTPEPGTLGLLALGSLGLAFWQRRKAVGGQL